MPGILLLSSHERGIETNSSEWILLSLKVPGPACRSPEEKNYIV